MPSYVIIGASRGLGYQFIKTLSADPKNTIIGTARNPEPTLAQLKSDNIKNVHIFPGDMVDHASMTAAAQKTSEITGGVVDYLIVNGGYVSNTTAFLKPTEFIGQEKLWHDELTQSMATNTEGVLYSINAFIGLVKKSSIKKVIVISTGFAAFEAMAEGKVDLAVPYSLSKVAVNMLVQRYAAELEGEGVIFLALSPGMVLVQAESMEEAPPEVQWALGELTKKFQTLYPDFKGPILPEESIEAMLKVVDGLTIEQSGQFLSHYGNQTWL